jgi:hypothetical protein
VGEKSGAGVGVDLVARFFVDRFRDAFFAPFFLVDRFLPAFFLATFFLVDRFLLAFLAAFRFFAIEYGSFRCSARFDSHGLSAGALTTGERQPPIERQSAPEHERLAQERLPLNDRFSANSTMLTALLRALNQLSALRVKSNHVKIDKRMPNRAAERVQLRTRAAARVDNRVPLYQ